MQCRRGAKLQRRNLGRTRRLIPCGEYGDDEGASEGDYDEVEPEIREPKREWLYAI